MHLGSSLSVRAPSWPFYLLPGPLGNTYPLADSVSLIGLLTPNLPTPQVMVSNCFANCVALYFIVFFNSMSILVLLQKNSEDTLQY